MPVDKYSFGYPRQCSVCSSLKHSIRLIVEPHYRAGTLLKVMLIGQDPTIFNDPDKNRVKDVLMLNEEKGQLKRWLQDLFGKENFNKVELYATNIVKCTFKEPPSAQGGKKVLQNYFNNCKVYLLKEIKNYRPDLVLTFGEPAHYYFMHILPGSNNIEFKMSEAFKGDFYKISIDGLTFDYSPCLHIKTFRVAETYGDKVNAFKKTVRHYFK